MNNPTLSQDEQFALEILKKLGKPEYIANLAVLTPEEELIWYKSDLERILPIIALEKEKSRQEGAEAAYRNIVKSIGEKPKRKNSGFYNTMINAEVDGFNKCLWRVKKICSQLLTPPEATSKEST